MVSKSSILSDLHCVLARNEDCAVGIVVAPFRSCVGADARLRPARATMASEEKHMRCTMH